MRKLTDRQIFKIFDLSADVLLWLAAILTVLAPFLAATFAVYMTDLIQ